MKKNVHAENDLIQKEKVSLDSGDKGGKIKTFMSTAGQKTQELLQGIVEKTEQNGDGKVVLENAAALVNSAGTAAKRMLLGAAELADEASRQYELKKLNPLFESELYKDSETLPRFVRIIPREKRYAESELCTGAVGYRSTYSKQELVNIFQDSVEGLGLHLYPSLDEEFYFVDPTEPNRYLALSKYFDYLKDARINELQKIAQDLGAKHFRITYKEEKTTLLNRNVKAEAKFKKFSNAKNDYDREQKQYAAIRVAAEMDFPGHPPIEPQLRYLQHDQNVLGLIRLRMDEQAPLLRQTLLLEMSSTSGMSEKDAASIDTVLSGMKCSGNTSISSEVQNESRRYLEYEIEF